MASPSVSKMNPMDVHLDSRKRARIEAEHNGEIEFDPTVSSYI